MLLLVAEFSAFVFWAILFLNGDHEIQVALNILQPSGTYQLSNFE